MLYDTLAVTSNGRMYAFGSRKSAEMFLPKPEHGNIVSREEIPAVYGAERLRCMVRQIFRGAMHNAIRINEMDAEMLTEVYFPVFVANAMRPFERKRQPGRPEDLPFSHIIAIQNPPHDYVLWERLRPQERNLALYLKLNNDKYKGAIPYHWWHTIVVRDGHDILDTKRKPWSVWKHFEKSLIAYGIVKIIPGALDKNRKRRGAGV